MDTIKLLQDRLQEQWPAVYWQCQLGGTAAARADAEMPERIEITLRRTEQGEPIERLAVSGSLLRRWGPETVARQISFGLVWRGVGTADSSQHEPAHGD